MPSKTLMRASGGFGVPADSESGLPEFHGSSDPTFISLEELAAGRTSLGEFTASEDIPSSVFINVATDGRIRVAGVASNRPAMGFTLNSTSSGGSVEVFSCGKVDGLSGISRGVTYWLGNSGQVVLTPPGSGFVQKVGVGIESTSLAAYIEQPIVLA